MEMNYMIWFVRKNVRYQIYGIQLEAMMIVGNALATSPQNTEIELRGHAIEPGKLFHKWG